MSIWEPAAGDGNIVSALRRAGALVRLSDIKTGFDFLGPHNTAAPGVHAIVTNPPYNLAEAFIRHALDMPVQYVAMLLRNEYDCAKTRSDLFERDSFWRKIVLTKRPYWTENRTASPRHNYAWYIWNHAHKCGAVIEYGHPGDDKWKARAA